MKAHNIILIGMKNCGKSTLGEILSSLWNAVFIDLDDLIIDQYGADDGLSVREVYSKFGKRFFRKLEVEAAEKLGAELNNGRPVIAALGGGTVANKKALRHLRGKGVFLYLKEKPDIIYNRLLTGGLPPFLSTTDPYSDFMRLYNEQTSEFERVADLTVDLSGTIERSAKELIATLKDAGHGW